MKKGLLKGLALTLGALVISGTTTFAATLVEGNDTNHESHYHEMENAKIDPPTQGSHLIADGRIEVIIKDSKVADVIVLDESINVEYVHMKGGNSFNCYDYVGEPLNGISQATDLNCPTNNSGKNADISHITIYWEEVETETTPEVEVPAIPGGELPTPEVTPEVEHPAVTIPDDFEIPEIVGDGTEEDNNQVLPEYPTTTIPDDFEIVDKVEDGTSEDNNVVVPEVEHPTTTIPDDFEVPEIEHPTMTIPDSFEIPEIVGDGTEEDNNVVVPEYPTITIPDDVLIPETVLDGSEEDNNVVTPEEEVVVVPPTVEEPKEEEVVVVTPPVVEEVPQVEETVNVPTLPYTGGTDSLMLILGSLGMVGTGLRLFKRK